MPEKNSFYVDIISYFYGRRNVVSGSQDNLKLPWVDFLIPVAGSIYS